MWTVLPVVIPEWREEGVRNFFLIRECQSLLQNPNWTVVPSHCYRESNRAADHLANLGVDQSFSFTVLDGHPNSVRSLLSDDVSAVAWSHFIRT